MCAAARLRPAARRNDKGWPRGGGSGSSWHRPANVSRRTSMRVSMKALYHDGSQGAAHQGLQGTAQGAAAGARLAHQLVS